MRFSLRSSVALSAMLLAAQAGGAFAGPGGPYDWSGFYLGGLIGGSSTSSDADFDYSNDGGDPAEGWVDGEFHGDVYNSLASLTVSNPAPPPDPNNPPMPDLTDWAGSLSDDSANFMGTVLGGINFQNGDFVFGGEFRTSFGDFGASNSSSWSDSGTRTGTIGFDNEGDNAFDYENFDNVLVGIIAPFSDNTEGINYTATYHQDSSIDYAADFDYMISPVARLGLATDRVLFFAMAGPTYTHVKATTSASIHEYTTDASVRNLPSEPDNFSADETYEFSGSNSKGLWGFTIGGGAEWAMTDNIIIRAEAEYHDLGTISVTGTSESTDATYTVKQKLDGYSASTGIIFKF